ncbi:MAG: helix-turn-helix domain-containing protein [Nanoarchaeota archaeon]|nr:helix-turn-helix domain-containing protein [Nanoarchaeota archaeon]
MWVARMKIIDGKGVFGSRAKKFNISLASYPVLVRKKGDYLFVDSVSLLFGAEKNKNDFIKDLKKADEVVNLEVKNDLIISQVKDPKELEPAYTTNILNLEPVLIDAKGNNFYTIGSWKREELNKFLSFLDKNYEANILKVEKKIISNFYLINLRPELTKRQKKAIELAIREGYYNYPRKTSVKKLAKMSKISFSAFHAHLRKAEQKLLPVYLEK